MSKATGVEEVGLFDVRLGDTGAACRSWPNLAFDLKNYYKVKNCQALKNSTCFFAKRTQRFYGSFENFNSTTNSGGFFFSM